jgi:hypothetical protein
MGIREEMEAAFPTKAEFIRKARIALQDDSLPEEYRRTIEDAIRLLETQKPSRLHDNPPL